MSTKKTSGAKVGNSLGDFRKEFDKSYIVPERIRQGLKKLGKNYMKEAEFIRHCGVSNIDFNAYREEFEETNAVYVRSGKRVWFGHPDVAKEAREMVQR